MSNINSNFNVDDFLDHNETKQLSKDFAALFSQFYGNEHLHGGDIIKGTVVDIDEHVIVSVGLKSYAYLPKQQFKNMQGELNIQTGDQIDVFLEQVENGYGETLVSYEKAKRVEAWLKLEEAFKNEQILIGTVCERVKGGFIVDLNTIRAFLPGSQLETHSIRHVQLEGQKLALKIIKMDKNRNNIVVSRKAVVESENSLEREKLLDSLFENKEMKGIVKNLTPYGAFINLGGVIDGLLHVTDMSWKRIKHPSDLLKVGDEISVKVLKFDKEKQRVSLGMKQLEEDPWLSIVKSHPVGTQLQGEVMKVMDYGCFVSIEETVEGLVHMSEMDWTNKNVHPSKVVQVGQIIEVKVLSIDEERRRISLGIKQCKENPWEYFGQEHEVGERVKGKIRSTTDFGIFVGLESLGKRIDGLVHLSDISWRSTADEKDLSGYHKDDEIEAVILSIDVERERISLGIKQLEENPYSHFMSKHLRGDIVDGVVIFSKPRKVILSLEGDDSVRGVLKISELNRRGITDPVKTYTAGEALKVKIVAFDSKNNIVNVLFEDGELYERKEKISKQDLSTKAVNTERSSLGNLIKEQLSVEDIDKKDDSKVS